MRIWFSVLVICGVALSASAQHKLFAVSGQGRGGSPADAKQAAQIGKLESENVDRKAETTQNAGDIAANAGRIGTAEGRIDAAETRLSDIETSCATDQKLRWDGSAWLCVQEQDPTVGIHGKTGAPPDCHDVNAKLLWNASTNAWHCVADQNDGSGGGYGSGYETDPQVGSTHSGRMCRGTGGQVVCDSAGPQVIGGGGLRVSGNLQVGGTIAGDDATFSGAVAADTPTASNHLTTKAYVDQSAPNPPVCTGAGKALQWDGSNWICSQNTTGNPAAGYQWVGDTLIQWGTIKGVSLNQAFHDVNFPTSFSSNSVTVNATIVMGDSVSGSIAPVIRNVSKTSFQVAGDHVFQASSGDIMWIAFGR